MHQTGYLQREREQTLWPFVKPTVIPVPRTDRSVIADARNVRPVSVKDEPAVVLQLLYAGTAKGYGSTIWQLTILRRIELQQQQPE